MYRDAGNFKNFGEAYFENPHDLSLESLTEKIKSNLLDDLFFDAYAVGLPELFFEDYDDELDHDWHEFDRLEQVVENNIEDDLQSISDFIEQLEAKRLT
ncbi:hypothetical protein H8K32_10360 [Undibacterium jejuense]|uniref:DUF4375 domain-containing protein n=1 Tax=Undibacterium jejuense TaxID=1344949 RepID=A0A923HIU1_9BURK|nr:hypothetical protein [Undibacterium jejuense]MBC3862502.1 hypothetical protein [Undibacterium jejuense]